MRQRHVLITGSGGFIGSRLVARLLREPDFQDCRLTLLDLAHKEVPTDPRVRVVEGDIAESNIIDAAIDGQVDLAFHLAGVLGGAAEANYDLSRRINIDATLDLLERLRRPGDPVRVVFASSIGVYGPPLPERFDDDTVAMPTMVYGAQKRMIEIAIEQFSARGWIDGIAVRLPGIVARPDADARLKSAFLNTLFYDYAAGRDIVLPVSPHGTTWLISVPTCVDAFVHAAQIPPGALGPRRAFNLPAQTLRIDALVEALARRFPASPSRVRYEADEALESQFARQPPLSTALADALGFRHDGTIDRLVERAILT